MRSHQLTTEAAAAGVPRHDWVTEFCGKWSGHEMVAAGDVLDWLMRHVPASPVAPAGVPSEWASLSDADVLRIAPMVGNFSKDERDAFCAGFRRCASAVLSAGAPAVPLQESDSSSVHLAAPGSTVPTALTVGTPSDDYDANPDGIKPGQDSHVRMDPDTGCWEPLA